MQSVQCVQTTCSAGAYVWRNLLPYYFENHVDCQSINEYFEPNYLKKKTNLSGSDEKISKF